MKVDKSAERQTPPGWTTSAANQVMRSRSQLLVAEGPLPSFFLSSLHPPTLPRPPLYRQDNGDVMAIKGPEQRKEKMGRVIRDDPVYRRMLLARGKTVAAGPAPVRAGGSGARVRPRQTVLKVISYTKSSSGVTNMVNYVARDRAEDRAAGVPKPVLRDETGTVITPAEARRRLGDEWGVVSDSKNLSKKARAAPVKERLEMPVEDRLFRRQAAHVTFSVQVRDQREREIVEGVLIAGVGTLFGSDPKDGEDGRGFPVVWAMHEDHGAGGRIHAHFIVPVKPKGKKQALRMGPRDLLVMRGRLTERLQEMGIDVEATMREDRGELREKIAHGEERLRAPGRRDAGRGKREITAARVPEWAESHGLDYAARTVRRLQDQGKTLAVPPKETKKRGGQAPEVAGDMGEDLGRVLGEMYMDSVEARDSWEAMRRELQDSEKNKGLADWLLVNRPEFFGETRARLPKRLRPLVRKLAAGTPVPPRPATPASGGPGQGERLRKMVQDARRLVDLAYDAGEVITSLDRVAVGLGLPAESGIGQDPVVAAAVRKEMRTFAQLAQDALARGLGIAAPAPARPTSGSGGRTAEGRDGKTPHGSGGSRGGGGRDER